MVFEQSAELRSVCWLFRLNRINLPVNLNSVCLTMQILKRERESGTSTTEDKSKHASIYSVRLLSKTACLLTITWPQEREEKREREREREREFRWWLNGGRDYRWMDEERESERNYKYRHVPCYRYYQAKTRYFTVNYLTRACSFASLRLISHVEVLVYRILSNTWNGESSTSDPNVELICIEFDC